MVELGPEATPAAPPRSKLFPNTIATGPKEPEPKPVYDFPEKLSPQDIKDLEALLPF